LNAKRYVNESSAADPQELNPGEVTSVIFCPSDFGGVVFEWQKKGEIGVPIYPRSIFSADKSYSGFGGFCYYVFITDDDVETVAHFYSQQLGVIAIRAGLPLAEPGTQLGISEKSRLRTNRSYLKT